MIKRFLSRWFVTRAEYENHQEAVLKTFKAIDDNFRLTVHAMNTLGEYSNALDARARVLWDVKREYKSS